jgi:hypothetical protein
MFSDVGFRTGIEVNTKRTVASQIVRRSVSQNALNDVRNIRPFLERKLKFGAQVLLTVSVPSHPVPSHPIGLGRVYISRARVRFLLTTVVN